MKKDNGKNVQSETISAAVIDAALRIIAVQRGLALPETVEEVEAYENAFASELKAIRSRSVPDLSHVIKRAQQALKSGKPLMKANPSHPDSDMSMAARNGAGLSEESLRLMDEASEQNPNGTGGDED